MTKGTIASGQDLSTQDLSYGYDPEAKKWTTDPYEVSQAYAHLTTPAEKNYTEEDGKRHEWHRANAAGFRVADAIERSFGPDAQKNQQTATHPIAPNDLRDWRTAEEAYTIVPHAITDDASYSLTVTHVPADWNKRLPRMDRLTIKAETQTGSSWESTLNMLYGKTSFADNIGHQLITSHSGKNAGEALVQNAAFKDIQAFSQLLKTVRNLPFNFPPPLKP